MSDELVNSSETQSEVDINQIVTDLNSKLNKEDIWYDQRSKTLHIGK